MLPLFPVGSRRKLFSVRLINLLLLRSHIEGKVLERSFLRHQPERILTRAGKGLEVPHCLICFNSNLTLFSIQTDDAALSISGNGIGDRTIFRIREAHGKKLCHDFLRHSNSQILPVYRLSDDSEALLFVLLRFLRLRLVFLLTVLRLLRLRLLFFLAFLRLFRLRLLFLLTVLRFLRFCLFFLLTVLRLLRFRLIGLLFATGCTVTVCLRRCISSRTASGSSAGRRSATAWTALHDDRSAGTGYLLRRSGRGNAVPCHIVSTSTLIHPASAVV